MILFTFCVDISKYSQEDLTRVANILIRSLNQSKTNLKRFIVFSNFDLQINNCPDYVEIRPFKQLISEIYESDKWMNLSLNKLPYYGNLMEEFAEAPIWIDLDTLVCCDISHLSEFENFFIQIGTKDNKMMSILRDSGDFMVRRNEYLQGNIFKLNNEILEATYTYVNQFKDSIIYDHQGAFNLVYHFSKNHSEMQILGKDIDLDSINSFRAWNVEVGEHPNETNANNLWLDQDGRIHSKLHPNKRLQFISFTFRTMLKFLEMEPTSNPLAIYLHSFDVRNS